MVYLAIALGLVSIASCTLLVVVCMASAQANRDIETERPIIQRSKTASQSVSSPVRQP